MPPQSPLGPIALSFSGGGYRAAGFHLGVLDLLHRLDLLQDLTALSTVSGGTFTGIRYAMSLKEGESFPNFMARFQADLLSVNVVNLALSKLTEKSPSIPSCRWDVITACAQVYDEKFFAGKRFEVFLEFPTDQIEPIVPTGFPDLAFNATEFRNAIAFRFQTRQNGFIGNGKVFINPEQAAQIRLADIAAASSCFPGGFEPLNFPDDFAWPDTPKGALALKELQAAEWSPLPLMDGGVYDNQGMGSLVLDEAAGANFGLFIISDTDQQQDDLYRLPKPRPAGVFRLWHLNVAWWCLLILAIATTLAAVWFLTQPSRSWPDLALHLLPLVMPLFTIVALVWTRRKIAGALDDVPKVQGSVWRYVKNLKVNQFIDMMELRITSLFALASAVFMRRIRRLIYNSVYADEELKKKIMPVLIYDLLQARHRPPPLDWLNPTDCMKDVASKAQDMKTTLWFDGPEQLRHLIAAGQITCCRKVLLHILSLSEDPTMAPPQLFPLFERARALYDQLRADPYAFAPKPPA
jgi:predicted acylesterase/phospholipase RssA